MQYSTHKPALIKQYARFVLVLFVFSLLNILLQAPAHAGMKMHMQGLTVFDTSDCYCPPVVCDSVLSVDSQTLDGAVSIAAKDGALYSLIEVLDQNSGQLNQSQHTKRLFLNVSQAEPPALLINTLLLI